jgi:hypothetical protein
MHILEIILIRQGAKQLPKEEVRHIIREDIILLTSVHDAITVLDLTAFCEIFTPRNCESEKTNRTMGNTRRDRRSQHGKVTTLSSLSLEVLRTPSIKQCLKGAIV